MRFVYEDGSAAALLIYGQPLKRRCRLTVNRLDLEG
jgi:hypothetical protein